MRKCGFIFFVISLVVFTNYLSAQDTIKDKGVFKEDKAGYYKNSILKGIEEFEVKDKKDTPAEKHFKVDFSDKDIPNSVSQFTSCWRNKPISQGNTGTCWSFSATSFFESEVYRLYKKEVKLSEMYTVYWEYVEKAKRFVRERGNSLFDEGSEGNAVPRIWKLYGIVPEEDYTGLKPGQKFHDHTKMLEEMNSYLNSVKKNNEWDEERVITTIKSIVEFYMGRAPDKIFADGKEITPDEYLNDVLKLNLNDYYDVISLKEDPYFTMVEYDVPDNWWHSKEYINIPLDIFMDILKNAVKNGYTVAVGGDVSEAGLDPSVQAAIVPTFDIPSDYIDEDARQFRYSNSTTGDDHGLHIVGYTEKNGKNWFLMKDSGSSSRNCGESSENFGYYFFHEDYVKLKMIDFMIHKDMLKYILNRINNK